MDRKVKDMTYLERLDIIEHLISIGIKSANNKKDAIYHLSEIRKSFKKKESSILCSFGKSAPKDFK